LKPFTKTPRELVVVVAEDDIQPTSPKLEKILRTINSRLTV
jgi:hypothetical protein